MKWHPSCITGARKLFFSFRALVFFSPGSYKLSRSRLKPSLLLTLLTTPSLKNFSSPPAVLPPIYHLSAPIASLKPSLLLSLPRRRPDAEGFGIGIEAALLPRGEWIDTLGGGERLFAWADDAAAAAAALVAMVRGAVLVWGYDDDEVEEPTAAD